MISNKGWNVIELIVLHTQSGPLLLSCNPINFTLGQNEIYDPIKTVNENFTFSTATITNLLPRLFLNMPFFESTILKINTEEKSRAIQK